MTAVYSAKISYRSQVPGGEWRTRVEEFAHLRGAFPSRRAAAIAMAKWLRSEFEEAKEALVTQAASAGLSEAFFLAAVSLAEEMDGPDPWTPAARSGLSTATAAAVDDDGNEHEVDYLIQGA